MSTGGRGFVARGRLEWSGEAGGDAAEHRRGGDGEGGGTTSYDRGEGYTVRS